ncbi:MAG: VanZ family protein [Lachnospiraceae bacterium]|jgi:VanZ family protein|nr:VanZ family protein [Lachnospiraceae bacterium]MCX4345923.1 VanZ family protein [Lachnospiraceae bacterium]
MKRKLLKGRKIWSALPMLLLMGVIFSFSAKTAVESSRSSNVIVDVLMDEHLIGGVAKDPEKVRELLSFLVRKSAHMAEFAVLAMLALFWLSSFPMTYRRRCILAVLISACYAATDEFHQLFVPGRSGEVRDVLVDTAGAVIGILFLSLLRFIIIRKKKKQEAVIPGS